ncbi:zinc finger protein STOP1 homolog [Aristolochia californica]|uniref:zinc finger protein STOP1 homolog n=1 Tax=Aristolochia californica TaxID=171875 RepID=UPI0035E2FDAC
MELNLDFSSLSESMDDEISRLAKLGQDLGLPAEFEKFGFDRNCNFSFDQLFPKLPLPPYQDSDPRILLNNLVFIEQKVRDLQGVVRSMSPETSCITRQQMVASEITSIIVQVISTAGKLMQVFGSPDVDTARQSGLTGSGGLLPQLGTGISEILSPSQTDKPSPRPLRSGDAVIIGGVTVTASSLLKKNTVAETRPTKDEDTGKTEKHGENFYQVLELEKEEILAPHAHFCTICGKGFKRDANLRMHMRGHGDIYKTPDALANPNKSSKGDLLHFRYSCPFAGCRRNRKHKNFQPLKTILCVRNHYKRSHCDKSFTCSRCNSKRFSVLADLKTHEKHCGEEKWQCSCGTTFSRKDKLFGHIALFQGHTPVVHASEVRRCSRVTDDCSLAERKKTGGSGGSEFSIPDLLGDRVTNVQCSTEENHSDLQSVVMETMGACPRSPGAFLESQISLHSLLSCECDFDDPNAGNMSPEGM